MIGTDSVAFLRERVARRLAHTLSIQIHELPFGAAPLGIDVLWNPSLTENALKIGLAGKLRRAANGG